MAKRFAPIVVAFMLTLGSLVMSTGTVSGWSWNCVATTVDSKFAGWAVKPGGGYSPQGAKATIAWNDPSLCNPVINTYTWSLSWISLDADPTSGSTGVNIFQGGFAKCADPTITASCSTWNNGVSYYFWAYGHQSGNCGAAFFSGEVKAPKGNGVTGLSVYSIEYDGTSAYNFTIDTALQKAESSYNIDTCWGQKPYRAEYENEMLNPNDQNGGTTAVHQSYSAIQLKYNSNWHDVTLPYPSACLNISITTYWQCNDASGTHSFYEYDTRA